MRGEHLLSRCVSNDMRGSSPHARGARGRVLMARRIPGIIPACAGSTRRRTFRRPASRDHPRMRGEHLRSCSSMRLSTGSSPHARGARLRAQVHRRRVGIIPACAGSTTGATSATASMRDHPRMRGEHARSASAASRLAGSSPHARGAREVADERHLREGIIHACAGSTHVEVQAADSEGDHPRMRGEHASTAPYSSYIPGSSPHARGAHAGGVVTLGGVGIIPACAGSTSSPGSRSSAIWDHPRMRGEHPYVAQSIYDFGGSSPHARGAPAGLLRVTRGRGIIPACAGSTSPSCW